MKKESLKHYREILNGKLDELLNGAERAVNGMSDSKEDNFPDPGDRASHETDRNFLLRVKNRERKLISKVKEAMERIDDGSYGICEHCGEEIGAKRLGVRRATTSRSWARTEE